MSWLLNIAKSGVGKAASLLGYGEQPAVAVAVQAANQANASAAAAQTAAANGNTRAAVQHVNAAAQSATQAANAAVAAVNAGNNSGRELTNEEARRELARLERELEEMGIFAPRDASAPAHAPAPAPAAAAGGAGSVANRIRLFSGQIAAESAAKSQAAHKALVDERLRPGQGQYSEAGSNRTGYSRSQMIARSQASRLEKATGPTEVTGIGEAHYGGSRRKRRGSKRRDVSRKRRASRRRNSRK